MLSFILWVTILGMVTVVYFVPTFIALFRDHHRKLWIFVVNLLGGITGIAWIGALVWALLPTGHQTPNQGQGKVW